MKKNFRNQNKEVNKSRMVMPTGIIHTNSSQFSLQERLGDSPCMTSNAEYQNEESKSPHAYRFKSDRISQVKTR